jgi:hypothetical protein
VIPFTTTAAERFLLVLFEEINARKVRSPSDLGADTRKEDTGADKEAPADSRDRELEQEPQNTREYMQSIIEDQESTN